MARYWPLVWLALLHAIVDSAAMLNEPLWPRLAAEFHLSELGLSILLSVKLLTPNFSQGLFGFLRDRHELRMLLWLGPLVAVVGLSLFGASDDLLTAGLALCIGMIGVGAFHPEAVVLAGAALPEQRTRGVSLFLLGGTLGLGIGPVVGGWIVHHHGLHALRWLMLPGAALVLGCFALSGLGRTALASRQQPSTGGKSNPLAGKGKLAAYLLLVSALRVVPNVGLTQAIAFTLDARGADSQVIGMSQSVFLFAGSLGMLLMATRFPAGWERPSLVLCPLIGIPLLAPLGLWDLPQSTMIALWFLAGLVLNGTTPAVISYAHQLFPNGAGLASALTMGMSWGVAGLVVACGTSVAVNARHPEWLYLLFVPCLLLSALGACFLPRAEHVAQPEAPVLAESTG